MIEENREFCSNVDIFDNTHSESGISCNGNPKQDRLNTFVVKHFSKFIILSLILDLILIRFLNASTFAETIYAICLGFEIGFFILGLISYALSDKSMMNWKLDILTFMLIPLSVSGLLWILGEEFEPNKFLMVMLSAVNIADVTWIYLAISILFLFVQIFFVSFAVVSVIVGFFRKYTFHILRFIARTKDSDSRKKRFTYEFFKIPDIIDVENIELDPIDDTVGFDKDIFMSVSFYLFTLGVVICSYIFLNPFFLTEFTFDEMILIAFTLSLFISPLVLPWNIMRSVGANVRSKVRPYYLWKGMKSRMYQGFFAVSFIMMILMLSAYLGMDFSRILTTYIGYIIFMGTISIFTSYIYVNYFYRSLKNGIIIDFFEYKHQ